MSDTNNNAENLDSKKGNLYPQKKKKYYPRQKYYKNKNYYYNKYRNIQKISFSKVSVVVPLFNEEESISPLTEDIVKAFKNLSSDYEVLFIDDGSTDHSLEVIKNLRKNNKRIRYISFRKNYGKSAALQVGFKNTTGDAIITMDADLQDDPFEIPNLLAELEKGYDLVSGWKKKRNDPFIKKHSSKFFNWVTRIMTGIKLHDFNCGLKAYKSETVKKLNVHGELHRYIPVLADWQGFTISEIVVKHHSRKFGKTKFGISRFFKGFVDLITVLSTTRYISRPMHLFGFLGALSFFAGIIINGYLSYEWIFRKMPLSNRPLLFLGMLLIIVGVQFFSIGLLGEMMLHNINSNYVYNIKEES